MSPQIVVKIFDHDNDQAREGIGGSPGTPREPDRTPESPGGVPGEHFFGPGGVLNNYEKSGRFFHNYLCPQGRPERGYNGGRNHPQGPDLSRGMSQGSEKQAEQGRIPFDKRQNLFQVQ